MRYQHFHMSRVGASHIRRGRPCQDFSVSEEYNGGFIAVAADGHGNRKHFRSERGAQIACQIALKNIKAFLDDGCWDDMDSSLESMKEAVCAQWDAAVREDWVSDPWTEAELEEERLLLDDEQFSLLESGITAPRAYGSTLCAAFYRDGRWAAIQLGDGCFVRVGRDGSYDWPMPESTVNQGNRTASLCMSEPMWDFRHCWGEDSPAALLVFTDGIEKAFPDQGREIISFLHWIWRSCSGDGEKLTQTLDTLTGRSANGDDVSISGIVDSQADDAEPVIGINQRRRELARLEAQLAEYISTIAFSRQRQESARDDGSASDAVEQLQNVIDRKEAQALELRARIDELRAELDMPPLDDNRETGIEPAETVKPG